MGGRNPHRSYVIPRTLVVPSYACPAPQCVSIQTDPNVHKAKHLQLLINDSQQKCLGITFPLQKENVKTRRTEVYDRIDKLASPRLVEYWEQDPWAPPERIFAPYNANCGICVIFVQHALKSLGIEQLFSHTSMGGRCSMLWAAKPYARNTASSRSSRFAISMGVSRSASECRMVFLEAIQKRTTHNASTRRHTER